MVIATRKANLLLAVALVAGDRDLLKSLMKDAIQDVLRRRCPIC